MMSSEEDLDVRGERLSLSADVKEKGGKTTKRVRQRVDAGEPRNSYASIPNFSSRTPGFGGGNGFASKMLCDLIGQGMMRTSKEDMLDSGQDRTNGSSRMFLNGGDLMFGRGMESPERCSSTESTSSHLLRDILQQGRGGGVTTTSGGHGPKSPARHHDEDSNDAGCRMSAAVGGATTTTGVTAAASPGSSPGSSNSPPLENLTWSTDLQQQTQVSTADVKRARVETIVNNMLQGPGRNGNGASGLNDPQPSVNGCKKRKLYQPQQHETPAKNSINGDSELYDDDEDYNSDNGDSPLGKRRNINNPPPSSNSNNPELFTFKQQIRQVQQQLVALQQQYIEMCDNNSTDEDMSSRGHLNSERPRSAEDCMSDCEDMKPRIKDIVRTENNKPYMDYDNASLYDEQRRLVIDDGKDSTPSKMESRQSCIVSQNSSNCPNLDYEWLAESLKAELSTSLSQVVDAVVSRCVQGKAAMAKVSQTNQDTTDPAKDPTLLSQMLDRKSPRTGGGGKVTDRGTRVNGHGLCGLRTSPYPPDIGTVPKPPFFFPLKQPANLSATAAFLYGSPPQMQSTPQPYSSSHSTPTPQDAPEQTEAMSLVVTPKKKRHKVTDTRLHQRTLCGSGSLRDDLSPKYHHPSMLDPLPPVYHHPPPPLVPVSLPTTVAIPNPSLNQSELFHSFQYERLSQHFGAPSINSGGPQDDDGGPPLQLGALHPMLPFHHQRGSPDSLHLSQHMKSQQSNGDIGDMSDAGDSPAAYDPGMALISFPHLLHTSTLTPMHLRKAKLMFFYARYPSSAVLKMYFPDIKFNKNNTAQLVKWFSNFREFFYIQMEKYARQAMSEGIKASEDLKVNADSELLRVLNLHYNRNNHIEAPENFRYVVEQTLREFFKALVAGKDSEQSWKKSIYKIIARMDDNVPEYFKNPNFLESLE